MFSTITYSKPEQYPCFPRDTTEDPRYNDSVCYQRFCCKIEFAVIRNLIWTRLKVADLNFGCATFCALPSFGAVATFFSHTTFSSHKVNVKGSDIDMCSAIYFLFDHNTKYCTIYLCPHTVVATVWVSPWR